MVPWLLLDTAPLPETGELLKLWRRGEEFSIRIGVRELMNSRLFGSEEALASLACSRLRDRTTARVLIGGLGMGFTLRAALSVLGPGARVTVAELMPAVLAWARGPMVHLHGSSLDDPRLTLHEGDVADLIGSSRAAWDAILLDVDNGPEGFTTSSNDALYGESGLVAARAALAAGGVLAIWSAVPAPSFATRLARSGFGVEEARARAHRGRSGARHVIWLGTPNADRPSNRQRFRR